MRKNRQIAVIGAGLMGHGIALTLARAGQYVAITDPFEDARASVAARIGQSLKILGEDDKSIARILKKIEIVSTTGAAVKAAEVVFEAAPEKLDLKRKIFAEIEAVDTVIKSSFDRRLAVWARWKRLISLEQI